MAQSMEFLTQNLFWDQKGYVVHLLTNAKSRPPGDDYLNLSTVEKLIYLKYYLEADGGVILGLCKSLLERGELTRTELLSTPLIDEIFIDVWESYRLLSTDLRQKVALREKVRKIRTNPYTRKTRIHKALAHVEPLVDLGLAVRNQTKTEVSFTPKKGMRSSPVAVLVECLGDIPNLERLFSEDKQFLISSDIYELSCQPFSQAQLSEQLRELILKTYSLLQTSPSGLVPIFVISDVACSKMLADHRVLPGPDCIRDELEKMKRECPSDVHFHVDMHGRKDFVVFSKNLIKDSLVGDYD